jgi:hypothetical protein
VATTWPTRPLLGWALPSTATNDAPTSWASQYDSEVSDRGSMLPQLPCRAALPGPLAELCMTTYGPPTWTPGSAACRARATSLNSSV